MRAEGPHNPVGQSIMRAEGPHSPSLVRRPKTDLGRTSGKIPSDGLVKPVQELAKLVIETNSKVCEPKTYNEAVNNAIDRNK